MRKIRSKALVTLLGFSAVLIQGCGVLNQTPSSQDSSCALNKSVYALTQSVPLASGRMVNTGIQYELAQSFTTSSRGMTVKSVTIPMLAVGNPATNAMLTLKLQGESAQIPDGFTQGSAIAVVGPISKTGFTAVKFVFSSDVKLTASKRYWLRLSSDLPVSNSDYLVWAGSLNTYNEGEAKYALTTNSWQSASISDASGTIFGGTAQDLAFSLDCK